MRKMTRVDNPFDLAVEAVLQVMDGKPMPEVAQIYKLSLPHLRMLVSGAKLPQVLERANLLYVEYRKQQMDELASIKEQKGARQRRR
jgi:hypothetical protein